MGNFIYNTGIPAASNNPSNDQPLMLQNNNSINSLIQIDHYGFNNSNNLGGYHIKSTYPNQGSGPSTAVGQLALYSKAGTSGSVLYMIRDNNSSSEVALTTSAVTAPSKAQRGYSWLPGNLLFQWGYDAVPNPGFATINFPFPYANPGGFAPIVTATPFATDPTSSTGVLYISNTSAITFQVANTDKTGQVTSFHWHAIGPI